MCQIEFLSAGSNIALLSRPEKNLTDFCAEDSARPSEMETRLRIDEIYRSKIEKKHRRNSYQIIHCPTSEGVSEGANE